MYALNIFHFLFVLVCFSFPSSSFSFENPRKPNFDLSWNEPIEIQVVALVDREDVTLAKAAAVSLSKIEKMASKLGAVLNLPVKMYVFNSDVPFKEIEQRISNVDFGRNIVFLFYFGHGVREDHLHASFQDFPLLASFANADPTDLIASILDDEPHFMIALLDACNTELGTSSEPISDFLSADNRTFSVDEVDYEYLYSSPPTISGYSLLFVETSGFMALTSASPGQVAYYDDVGGGLMTSVFVSSVERELKKYNPRWDRIFPNPKNLRLVAGTNEIQSPTGHVCFVLPNTEIRCASTVTGEFDQEAEIDAAFSFWEEYSTIDKLRSYKLKLDQRYFDSILNAGKNYHDEVISIAVRFISGNEFTGTAPLYGIDLLEQVASSHPIAAGHAADALLHMSDWPDPVASPELLLNRALDNASFALQSGDFQALFTALHIAYFRLFVGEEYVTWLESKYFEVEGILPEKYLRWRDEICQSGAFAICG